MKKVYFINRFYWPDNSATSLILSELMISLNQPRSNFELIVLAGSAKHIDLDDVMLPQIQSLKCKRFFQIPNHQRRLFLSLFNVILFNFTTLIWLIIFTRRDDTVVAMSDPPLLSVPVALARIFRKFYYISWQQDIFPETAFAAGMIKMRTAQYLLRTLRSASLKHASVIITPSVDMAYYLSRNVVSAAGKLKVIENFSISSINPLPNSTVKTSTQGPITLGYFGNLGIAHDINLLRQFLDTLKYSEPFMCKITGGGVGYRTLQQNFKSHAKNNVIFRKYVASVDLNEELNALDFHIVCLKDEFCNLVFPSKFYNALKLNKPTIYIGPRQSEIARILAEFKIGVCISEPNDIADALHFISRYTSSDAYRAEIISNCQVANDRLGNLPVITKEWEKVLGREAISPVVS